MWPFGRFKRAQGTASTPRLLTCSFCGKSQDDVRKLIAGPGVYICDECVDLCNDILTKEGDQGRSELETPAPKSHTPASSSLSRDLFLTCGFCGLPQSSTGLVAVPDRRYVCGACVDAIRAVTDEESG
jgi:hypothetical protein